MTCARHLIALVALVLLGSQPGLAATYALVVGINEYDAEADLNGAVNDARDVAAALETYGAEEVRLLLDHDAGRKAIETTLKDLIARAEPGDTVVFAYSGHGSWAPAWNDASEADGRDEFFVLSRFDRNDVFGTGRERIVDNELRQWLKSADDKGVNTILVADSCYSGGMSRGFKLGTRASPPVTVPLPPPGGDKVFIGAPPPSEMKHATFISGALESQLVYEVIIEDQPRGALSYAFSRAIEGWADRNGDSEVSRAELQDYVAAVIKSRAASLQAPEFVPRSAGDDSPILFANAGVRTVADGTDIPDIPFRAVGGDIRPQGTVQSDGTAYEWDAATGQLVTPFGDIAASGVTADALQAVIDKYRLVEALNRATDRASASISIAPFRQVYDAGDRVSLQVAIDRGYEVLVFDLVNDGSVQYLGHYAGTDETEVLAQFEVVPPFGADHVIALALPPARAALGETMFRNTPSLTSADLLTGLQPLLGDARVGVQPFFTRKANDG